MTDLRVQRKEGEVHGAGHGEGHLRGRAALSCISYNLYSDAVENHSVREDSHVQVGLDDVVKLRVFLISEESVWHPDLGGESEKNQRNLFWPDLVTLSQCEISNLPSNIIESQSRI